MEENRTAERTTIIQMVVASAAAAATTAAAVYVLVDANAVVARRDQVVCESS